MQIPEVFVSDEEYNLLTSALAAAESSNSADQDKLQPLQNCYATAAVSCYLCQPPPLYKRSNTSSLVLTLQPRPRFPPHLHSQLLSLCLRKAPSKHAKSTLSSSDTNAVYYPPYEALFFSPDQLVKLRPLCRTHGVSLSFPDILSNSVHGLLSRQEASHKPYSVTSTIPKVLWTSLHPFQRTGVLRAISALNGRVLIADDMGLGKTVQALAIAEFFRLSHMQSSSSSSSPSPRPVVVLCPATIRTSWARAIVRWIPSATTQSVSVVTTPHELKFALAPPAAPRDAWDSPQKLTHIVCTYDLLPRLAVEDEPTYCLLSAPSSQSPSTSQSSTYRAPKIIIADECHMLRNVNTARTRAAMPFITSSDIRILVSGTPALSRPADIYSVLLALLHDTNANHPFLSFPEFSNRYIYSSSCASRAHELNAILSSVMIRRSKKDVQVVLAPKKRVRVVAHVAGERLQHITEMLQQAHELDLQIRNQCHSTSMFNSLKPAQHGHSKGPYQHQMPNIPTGFGSNIDTAIACIKRQREALFTAMYAATAELKLGPIITRLYQLLIRNRNNDEEDRSDRSDGSGAGRTNKKPKVLVFAHHMCILDAVDAFLDARRIPRIRIDGHTKCSRREALVDEFQSETGEIQVALLSINVAATGITLTKADVVLFGELCWVPAMLNQAENRAHRIGRVGPVTIEYVVVPGSLDDLMMRALTGKAGIVFKMVDDNNTSKPPRNACEETKDGSNNLEFQQEDCVSACMETIELSELDVQEVVSDCIIRNTAPQPKSQLEASFVSDISNQF